MPVFDQMYRLGWRLTARRFSLGRHWTGDLMFKKNNCVLVVETRRPVKMGMDKHTSAHVTADLMGTQTVSIGFRLFYSHMCTNTGRIRGIREWRRRDRIKTIVI